MSEPDIRDDGRREPYEPPEVEDLGTLVDLTLGAAGATADLVLTGSQ